MNTNWNEMTARERDAVVAEKVMGWKWYRAQWIGMGKDMGGKYQFYLTDTGLPKDLWDYCEVDRSQVPDSEMEFVHTEDYTTQIQAAWLVVERMKDARTFHLTRLEDDYECLFQGFGDDTPDGYAVEPTAPEAICLAALRAMGVEG